MEKLLALTFSSRELAQGTQTQLSTLRVGITPHLLEARRLFLRTKRTKISHIFRAFTSVVWPGLGTSLSSSAQVVPLEHCRDRDRLGLGAGFEGEGLNGQKSEAVYILTLGTETSYRRRVSLRCVRCTVRKYLDGSLCCCYHVWVSI